MNAQMSLELVHPDDYDRLVAYYTQIHAAQDGEILEIEYRVRHANGEWRWLCNRDAVFSRDANGQVTQIIGTAQDMTDRKRLEEEQNRLIAILEASTDYISMSDIAGNILWNNKALKQICSLISTTKVQQRQIQDYHPQWAADLILQQGLPAAIADGSWLGETALLDAEGQEIPLSQLIIAHKSPQGTVNFFSTIARDMRSRPQRPIIHH
jgi:PAS domain-containing protein